MTRAVAPTGKFVVDNNFSLCWLALPWLVFLPSIDAQLIVLAREASRLRS
jgi:hypothetical protein